MKVYVIIGITGEYSDTNWETHSYCTSQEAAEQAVATLDEVERVKATRREMCRKAAGIGHSYSKEAIKLYRELAMEAGVYGEEVRYYFEECEPYDRSRA